MKTVLCYGDSITWGYNPVDGSRFPFEQRWPGVLQARLGSSYRVIEEGLNGRTVATGPARETVTTDNVTAAFAHPVEVRYDDGRWSARAKATRIDV